MSSDNKIAVKPSILDREFNAPRSLVFDTWTQVEHLNNWMFPQKGFSCEYVSADIRSGGSSLHKMMTPNGHEMWLLTKYEEVSPPERLVFRQYMSNDAGDILPNPQMPTWPKEIRATITLTETGDKTHLHFVWEPIDPTEEEAATFKAALAERGNGWSAGLEQLTIYLESLGHL